MNYNKSLFEGVPKKHANKSRFNLSHEYKNTITPGRLTPILTLETLPGDEWNIESEFMFRFDPLYFPIMHKLTMRADYFYIPNRILWPYKDSEDSGWAKWIAELNEQTHPYTESEQLRLDSNVNYQVLGYMGIPILDAGAGKTTIITGLNAFPLSAYLKVYDEYFREPQLEDERWFPLEAGDNTTAFETAFADAVPSYFGLLWSNWEKDYFTSALPAPQIGDAISIPLNLDDGSEHGGPISFKRVDTGAAGTGGGLDLQGGGTGILLDAGADPINFDETTTATIKQLRIAEVLQGYYERIMKVGQRYRDFIKGLWGHDPQPMDVDVPVLFGSVFGRVQIADVMTQATNDLTEGSGMSMTGDYTGQANLYEGGNNNHRYACREHGWILCILQVNPNTSYGQGIERMWRRDVQTDYALDMFASIGDQEILKEEVLYNNITAQAGKNLETFGYIPRFSEYRYKNNMHLMSMNFTTGKSMSLGRIWNIDTVAYDTQIEIGVPFIKVNAVTNGGFRQTDVFRILPNSSSHSQESSQQVMKCHIFHSIYVNRPLPVFSTPNLT